ncbi:dityrosine transporter A [Cladochytrium replicatum]|nr:dityrosine transporter A [Cladochytrium replicatum]
MFAYRSIPDGQPKPATRAPPPPKYSIARRRFFLGLVALAGFLGPLAGNIYLPAMEPIRIELGVSVLLINLTVSLFMLTFALAPLGWSSAADLFGRRTIYIASLPIFIVSSIALAFTQSYPTLLVFRIFQGVGAAAVQSVGAGTIADLFPPLERGRAMSMFLLGPQLGPLVGPVIGGAVARYLGWRAVFVVLACLGGVVWAAIALFLPETLRKKLERMEEYPADKVIVLRFSRATREIRDPGTSGSSEILLPRYNPLAPLKMLSRRSILLCLIAVAIMFGSFYCVTVEVPVVFSTLFAFNELGVGLAYVALGLGFIIGSTAGGKVSDQMLKARMKAMGLTNAKDVPPEIRVRSQVVGLILFPIGLISFGITAYFAVHPAFVLVALFICGFGMTWTFTCNTTYLVDSFPGAAASVVALNSLFRNPAAAIGSAIIEPLVTAASYAGAFGIIGGCTVAASGLMVIVMVHGAKWRPNPAVPSA